MDPRFFRALPALFRAPTVTAVAATGGSPALDEVLRGSGLCRNLGDAPTLRQIFEALYATMRRAYRCEYLFKNAIANKVLLGRHSVRTSTLLTELRVEACKADLVVLNGTSTVYEIKTQLDNLDRLSSQLAAYGNVFDRICVVTEEGLEHAIAAAVGESVGIIVLTRRYTLRTVREPASNVRRVSPGSIFDTLRLGEYSAILRAEFGSVPDVPNGIRYVEHRRLFERIPPERAHARMVEMLKARSTGGCLLGFLRQLPHSLKVAGLTTPLSQHQQASLLSFLDRPYQLTSK